MATVLKNRPGRRGSGGRTPVPALSPHWYSAACSWRMSIEIPCWPATGFSDPFQASNRFTLPIVNSAASSRPSSCCSTWPSRSCAPRCERRSVWRNQNRPQHALDPKPNAHLHTNLASTPTSTAPRNPLRYLSEELPCPCGADSPFAFRSSTLPRCPLGAIFSFNGRLMKQVHWL